MLWHQTILTLESFTLRIDRRGAFDREICLEGWLLSAAKPTFVALVFPNETEIEIVDRSLSSIDVFSAYGSRFGEAARACRFKLREPVGTRDLDFVLAKIRIVIGSLAELLIPIGSEFKFAEPTLYAASEIALLSKFESVGDNCELGLVQRSMGIERLGLLRYAGVGDAGVLAQAIETRFVPYANAKEVMLAPSSSGEWMAHIPSARIALHTGRNVSEYSYDQIIEFEKSRVDFLIDKFYDDCATGEKIFVWRVLRNERGGFNGIKGMHQLYDSLRGQGGKFLLWVNEVDAEHKHATVSHIKDGLYRGWIDYLTPQSDAYSFSVRSWIDLLHVIDESIHSR